MKGIRAALTFGCITLERGQVAISQLLQQHDQVRRLLHLNP
jgi:hypothetical protein